METKPATPPPIDTPARAALRRAQMASPQWMPYLNGIQLRPEDLKPGRLRLSAALT